jgi:peroxidase
MREHNRIASALAQLNPCWGDEKLYQESRRINVAQYQHIVYKEWLPSIIGNNFMSLYGLWPQASGYSSDYADNFDPRINNEFAAAAFRFGHSLIPNTFSVIPSSRRKNETVMDLKQMFFKPEEMKAAGMLDNLVHGMMMQESQASDSDFVDDVRNHLFESQEGAGGLDLVALNIQRGRDHGIPGSNKYREICGIGTATVWSDLHTNINPKEVEKLRQIYRSIDDIDLFVGGVLEEHHQDSLVGGVFKCIIGDQFSRLKKGDRFFYDLGTDTNIAFSPEQLEEIRKSSLARVICHNTDHMDRIQPFTIKLPNTRSNAMRSCTDTSIPTMLLDPFKDNSCPEGGRVGSLTGSCVTVSGADIGSDCIFPFRYKKKLFRGCTKLDDDLGKAWCSTRTDRDSNHIGGEGNWGHCSTQCREHG